MNENLEDNRFKNEIVKLNLVIDTLLRIIWCILGILVIKIILTI